jgi:serine/threonine protein kinase
VENLPLVASGQLNLRAEQAKHAYNTLRETFPKLRDEGLELLHELLTYDPSIRITARAALRHSYFDRSPYPQEADLMPTFPTQHDSMMGPHL